MTPEQELEYRFKTKLGMFDSCSDDMASDIDPVNENCTQPEPDCWACHKQDCTCDEETMQAMDNDTREEDERNGSN